MKLLDFIYTLIVKSGKPLLPYSGRLHGPMICGIIKQKIRELTRIVKDHLTGVYVHYNIFGPVRARSSVRGTTDGVKYVTLLGFL